MNYVIELVGGKYDGVAGMEWLDDGQHPPPDRIIVGTCAGDGACQAGNPEWCRRMAKLLGLGGGAAHPAYWTPEEGVEPVDAERYRLTGTRENVDTSGPRTALLVAVYVQAGVSDRDPRRAREEAPLTVADILRAAPPAPVTALGRSLVQAAREAELFPPGRYDVGYPRGRQSWRRWWAS